MSSRTGDETVATMSRATIIIRTAFVARRRRKKRGWVRRAGRGERQDPTAKSDGKPTRRAAPRSARQVVEMNIVRGRGIRRKNVAERKNGGRDRAALESMRMSGGSERHQRRNGERADQRPGGERGVATEKRSPRENERDRETGECDEEVNDATVRARMTEGTALRGATRTDNAARAVVRESEVAGGGGGRLPV